MIGFAAYHLLSKDKFCGGFVGSSCAPGYTCVMEGNYPDAGGHCVLSLKSFLIELMNKYR